MLTRKLLKISTLSVFVLLLLPPPLLGAEVMVSESCWPLLLVLISRGGLPRLLFRIEEGVGVGPLRSVLE